MELEPLIQRMILDATQYIQMANRVTDAMSGLNAAADASGINEHIDAMNKEYRALQKVAGGLERIIKLNRELDQRAAAGVFGASGGDMARAMEQQNQIDRYIARKEQERAARAEASGWRRDPYGMAGGMVPGAGASPYTTNLIGGMSAAGRAQSSSAAANARLVSGMTAADEMTIAANQQSLIDQYLLRKQQRQVEEQVDRAEARAARMPGRYNASGMVSDLWYQRNAEAIASSTRPASAAEMRAFQGKLGYADRLGPADASFQSEIRNIRRMQGLADAAGEVGISPGQRKIMNQLLGLGSGTTGATAAQRAAMLSALGVGPGSTGASSAQMNAMFGPMVTAAGGGGGGGKPPMVTAAGGGFGDALGRLGSIFVAWHGFTQGLNLMVQGTHEIVQSFTKGMDETAKAGVEGFRKVVGGFVQGLAHIVQGLMSGHLGTSAAALVSGVGDMAAGVISGAGGAIGGAIRGMTTMIAGSISGLGKIISGGVLVAAAAVAAGLALTGVGAPIGGAVMVGGFIVSKMIEMISDVMGGIFGAIGRVVGTVVAGIADTLGETLKTTLGVAGKMIGGMLETGMGMERSQASFGGLLGGADKGAAFYGQIQDLSTKIPYTTKQLAEAAQGMLGMGVSADNVIPSLARLGDVAMGDADRFHRLWVLMGEVNAEGRITGQRLRQFASLGIGSGDFAATMGVSSGTFRSLLRGNMVPARVATDTYNRLTEEGRFGGQNERTMDTVFGRWTQLQSIIEQVTGRVSMAFMKSGGFADMLRAAGQYILSIMPQLERIGGVAGGFVGEAFKQVGSLGIAGVNMVAPMFGGMGAGDPKEMVNAAVEMAIDGIEGLAMAAANVASFLGDLMDPLAAMAGAVKIFIKGLELASVFLPGFSSFSAMFPQFGIGATMYDIAKGVGKDMFGPKGQGIQDFLHTLPDRVQMGFNEFRGNRADAMASDWTKFGAGAGGYKPGKIESLDQLSPEAQKLVSSTLAAVGFQGAGYSAHGKGITPLEIFQNQRSLIAEASGAGAMTPRMQQYAMYEAYGEVAKSVGHLTDYASHLTPAATYGSSEAADTIAKAQLASMTVEEEMLKNMATMVEVSKNLETRMAEVSNFLQNNSVVVKPVGPGT